LAQGVWQRPQNLPAREGRAYALGAAAADRFTEGKQAIDDFIGRAVDQRSANAWIEVPEGSMYLRIGRRPQLGKTLEIASLNFETKGTGAFTSYLQHMEDRLLESSKLEAIYVENIFNERLISFLERRGYVKEGGFMGTPPSMVMPKDRLELFNRPHPLG